MTLGAWPNEKLRVLDRKAAGPMTLWDVPLVPLKSLDLNDSAITIYWEEKPLAPGAEREVGFEYGLWNLASQGEPAGGDRGRRLPPRRRIDRDRLRQPRRRGGRRDRDPEAARRLQAASGRSDATVGQPKAGAKQGSVPITWRVQAGPTGRYDVIVTTGAGLAQTVTVEIRKSI